MGWNLSKAIGEVSRILGDRLASFSYTPDSTSGIGITFKGNLTEEEEEKIVSVFPEWIRVMFIAAQ